MTPDVLLLAAGLGIDVAASDRAAVCTAFERLLEQAHLVLSLPLPAREAPPGAFEP